MCYNPKKHVYFRTYAQEIGCEVKKLGDKAVWNYILIYQNKDPLP